MFALYVASGAAGCCCCCLSCAQIEFDEFLLMFRDQLLDLRVSNSVALRDRSQQSDSYTCKQRTNCLSVVVTIIT